MALRERLIYAIDVITDGARSGLNSFKSSVADTDTTVGKFKAGTTAAFDQVKANVAGMALAAGAALVTFGVKSVTAFQNTALEAGKFSDATRLSVEDASRWIEVAGDMGIEAGTIQTSFTKLNKELADGSPVAERYGLSLKKTADGAVDVNATMLEAIDVIKGIKDPTERAAAAQTLFGRSYAEVAELIETGADGVARSLAAVSDSKVIDEGELEKAREFREAMDELQDKLQDLMITVGEKVVPVIVGFVEGLEDLDDAVEAVHLDDFARGLEAVLSASPQIQALSRALGLLADDTDNLSDRTGELSGAWGGLKGAEAEAAAEAKKLNTTIEEQRDHTQRMGDVTRDARDAIAEKARADKEAERAAQDHADAIAEVTRQFQILKDELNDRSAYLGLQDQFDQVATAATEAWDASAAGAEDSEAKTRAHEQATIDLKSQVIDYATEVGNIPPETVTEINALIDEGKFAEAEAKLAHLERVRYVNVVLKVNDSNIRINADGRLTGAATGMTNWRGGPIVVGERGPELVDLPRGSTVHTNDESKRMLAAPASSSSVTIINNRRDLTSADVAQAIQMARLAR